MSDNDMPDLTQMTDAELKGYKEYHDNRCYAVELERNRRWKIAHEAKIAEWRARGIEAGMFVILNAKAFFTNRSKEEFYDLSGYDQIVYVKHVDYERGDAGISWGTGGGTTVPLNWLSPFED